MGRIGCTLPDSDRYLGAEIQPAGTNALQMMNNVVPDKSFCRRSCASAWNALMKNRRHAPGREQPGRHVLLHPRVCLLVERDLPVLQQSALRSQTLRSITIQFS